MKAPTISFLFVAVALASTLWVGCDSASDVDVLPNTLFGVVRDGGTPLDGLTAELSGLQATTDPEGRFEFREVALGAKMLRVTKTGFHDYNSQIDVQAGANRHDVALLRTDDNRSYEFSDGRGNRYELYLPPGVLTYRGVIFLPPPGELDSRGFASGIDRVSPPEGFNNYVAEERARALRLTATYDLALMGAAVGGDVSDANTAVALAALEHFAEESGHPELAQAPLLPMGFSNGGCFAYNLTRRTPDRVIGFISQKGSFCHTSGDAGQAQSVPGYFFFGAQESGHEITQLFQENRAQSALWALAIEKGTGHTPVQADALLFNWMNTVLAARLPETPSPGEPVVLRAINEASGWLGDRETFDIGDYAGYARDRSQATWLPSLQTAQDWQAFVTSTSE